MIDACKRASARSITAVIPYYGYARADRKTQVRARAGRGSSRAAPRTDARAAGAGMLRRSLAPQLACARALTCPCAVCAASQGRESIAAKLTANLITEAGADRYAATCCGAAALALPAGHLAAPCSPRPTRVRTHSYTSKRTRPAPRHPRVLAMDIHSGQCVGYFDIPVDHVHGEVRAHAHARACTRLTRPRTAAGGEQPFPRCMPPPAGFPSLSAPHPRRPRPRPPRASVGVSAQRVASLPWKRLHIHQ